MNGTISGQRDVCLSNGEFVTWKINEPVPMIRNADGETEPYNETPEERHDLMEALIGHMVATLNIDPQVFIDNMTMMAGVDVDGDDEEDDQ